VHEYAHIAHLTRPGRNRRQRLLWRLSPLPAGPVATRTPRWAIEGYATYVEGRLTGSGRPYGAARAAALRQWALEGELPRYAQLDGDGGYRGGEMAYLAGSAFMEWLIARTGEASLPNVWRRLTAVQKRGFDAAFAGVYGGTPAQLYGRFTAELTGRALAAERVLAADSAGAGTLVLAPRGYGYDDPAVSPDGALIAARVRGVRRPAAVLVVRAAADTVSDRERRARERVRRRDPEDVPAVEYLPRPHRVVARLEPSQEAGYEEPRFFADGKRVLVTRWTGRADGSVRPDLYEWTFGSGRVRRVTDGAGVRGADPAPDGRSAAAVRCDFGICDLVTVDLRSGALTVLAPGSTETVFDRPRFSPDGATVAVAVQSGGRWRVRLYHAGGGAPRDVGAADGASRYEPAFTRDGTRLLVTSERGGVPNIEVVELASGTASTITAVSGAAAAAAVGAGDTLVYYLNLRSEGLELRAVPLAQRRPVAAALADSTLAPALPPRPAGVVDTLGRGPLGTPRPYGLGARGLRYLPSQSGGSEGSLYAVAFASVDPIARLALVAQGGLGDRATWRGGSAGASYRGWRPAIGAELFAVRHEPGRERAPATPAVPDARRYAGGTASVTLLNDFGWRASRYHAGGSAGRVDFRTGWNARAARSASRSTRALPLHDPRRAARRGRGGATGHSGARATRAGAGGSAVSTPTSSWSGLTLGARGTLGATGGDPTSFERFDAGGIAVPFVDRALLSQRIAVPALPVGFATAGASRRNRFATAVAGFEPYYLALAAGDRIRGGWTRVIGAEQRVVTPPVGLLGLPRIEVTAGVGYPLTGPSRYDTQLYGGLTVRP
jgi:hypothetical protein